MFLIHMKEVPADLTYDYPHLIGVFLPGEPVFFDSIPAENSGALYTITQNLAGSRIQSQMILPDGEVLQQLTEITDLEKYGLKRDLKVYLKLNLYDLLSQKWPSKSPWGTLVGIRPVKLAHEWLDHGFDLRDIDTYLQEVYRVSEEKIKLMVTIAALERPILEAPIHQTVSLYICIPFCQTKCVYCSFPSNPLDKKGHLRTRYTDCLLQEIEAVANQLKDSGLTVDCLYIGGGTPTALDEMNFKRLLETVSIHFGTDQLLEYTVEAGRPDTITTEKLLAMKQAGVSRLCLNPQTMNNATLNAIGRTHTAEGIEQLYREARALGFDNINADLIVGLMDETLEDMSQTMSALMAIQPENVTLHTLAVKRASKLNEHKADFELQAAAQVEAMMDHASHILENNGYLPYYMYRQKQMIGNLENIGYAKPNHVCLYNVRIMEERHDIIALGAGAVSKLHFKETNRLERFSNGKGLEDYIQRIDEWISKKSEWLKQKYS